MGKNKDNYLPIDDLIDSTFDKIKEVIDANTIIGKTINIDSDKSIIPISRVSVGVVSGGGEVPSKKKNNMSISAGSTSGFTITPIGFVVVNKDAINYISVSSNEGATSKIFDIISIMCEKVLHEKGDRDEKI